MSFAHLTLATRDVERTRDFFAATLGWRPIERPNNIARPAAWLAMDPNGYVFEVVPAGRRHEAWDACAFSSTDTT